MFTLYTTPLSANGRKVLAVSHHLSLSPYVVVVNVYAGEGQRPEYLAVNPSGKIPTLVDGDFVLSESNAILQYIVDAYGGGALSSNDPRGRADIARWMFWEASQWQPALISVLTPVVAQRLGLVAGAPSEATWSDQRFRATAALLDAHLSSRAFLVGDALTIADFSVAGMMTYARVGRFPFDAYPHIGAWYARIEELEAWRASATAPWHQEDAAHEA